MPRRSTVSCVTLDWSRRTGRLRKLDCCWMRACHEYCSSGGRSCGSRINPRRGHKG